MTKSILFAAALATSALVTPAAAETNLSFNILFPQTHFAWPVLREWAEDVAKATDGEVKITFPAQSVAPPPGILDAVRNGVADAGFIYNGFLMDTAPGTMVTQMPWSDLGDSAAISKVFWESYSKNFGEVEKLRGVHLLSGFHLGPTYLCSTTDKPLDSLEELRKRRVWVLPGTISETMGAMDLSIIAGPAVQLQELTSRNTVDAHLGVTMETIISFGVAPYTKSCLDMTPAMQSASFTIFINQRSWDRLSPEHQQAITELSGAALAERLGEGTNQADDEARKQLEEMGVKFIEADPSIVEAMREASATVAASWITEVDRRYGVDGAAIIQQTQDAIKTASSQ